ANVSQLLRLGTGRKRRAGTSNHDDHRDDEEHTIPHPELAIRASQDGVEQDVDAGHGVIYLGVLRLVVRDAVPTWREDHRGRRDPGDVVRVVPGLAQDVAVADAELLGGLADGPDAARIEALGSNLPLAGDA